MKAVIWGYKYDDMRASWAPAMQTLVHGLQELGYEVVLKGLKCEGLDNVRAFDAKIDNPCDVVVYNHCDISHLKGNIVAASKTLFFKPTIPDLKHFTIDEMGYGPYSTISYDCPDFEDTDPAPFFSDKVAKWKSERTNKFSADLAGVSDLPDEYWLVLGQCVADETVTRHDFGDHRRKLLQIVPEIRRWSNIPVVVKLHPYMDGTNATTTDYSEQVAKELTRDGVHVHYGKLDIHSMLPRAKGVFLANSGAGIEAMMHQKPIISWGVPEYHWITYDLRHLADVRRAMDLRWFDRERQARWLAWYYGEYCVATLPGVKARLKRLGLDPLGRG